MYLQRQFITMTPRALFNTIRSSIAMSATSPSPAEARSFSAKSLRDSWRNREQTVSTHSGESLKERHALPA